MDRSQRSGSRPARFLPSGEGLEERQLLSSGSWPRYIPHGELFALLHNPTANPVVRPNIPVMPYGITPASSGFIDPTAHIVNGYAVLVATPSFIAPYTTLNAHGGLIKTGIGSVILDNASIVANPLHPHTAPAPEVLIGNQVVIGYGAQVLGPSTIGSYASGAPAAGIGPGAVIDQANVAAGAYVGALAQVGPGVTIPAGKFVLPGQTVMTAADLTNPAKVVTIQGNALATQQVNELNQLRATNLTLALGYIALYQGQAATGGTPGVSPTQTTIFNGNLANVEGAAPQPGAGTPTATTAPGPGPTFPSPYLVQA
ncbi:MAG: hypothetical protein JO161_11285, partial [Planctomycetaceae bacterium]|nr:hypothetical protein [Planctomycetaceae bacterium]